MRLYEYLKESVFVNEAFASNTLKDILTNPENKSFWSSGYHKNYLKWSDITDDDIEVMEPADAAKLVYKKSGDPLFIFWVNRNGKILCVTNELFVLYDCVSNIKSARAASKWSNVAYVIKDFRKFEASELRSQRRKAREGALALKSDLEVARENRERYEELKAKAEVEKLGDDVSKIVLVTVSDVINDYNELIDAITHSEDFAANYWSYSYKLSNLNKEFSSIMNTVHSILYDDNNFKAGIKSYGANMVNIKSKLEQLKESINKFKVKYDLD